MWAVSIGDRSQRTETYTTTPRGTAKLRHGTVYLTEKVTPNAG